MAYQALYRKYRPKCFEDVVGQENIVKTLKNSLNLNKISHAYLFSGPRGTGKTTLAKILAKNVNCLNLKDGNCCNECENCVSINKNECSDIIEIDAASNNGVDEIREIRNNINLVPTQLKYKVYIIDEVHMLSIGAFNALLKTLEEPPEHIIFILATTDLHKVPITIISRCQCFEFKRISVEKIVDRLEKICKLENITVDKKVLEKIAYISDGGMRDSLGMLDKLSSYSSNNNITMDDFLSINGILDDEKTEQMINALYNNLPLDILKISDYIDSSGKDYIVFVQTMIDIIRDKIVNYYTNKSENIDIDFYLKIIDRLNRLLVDLKNAGNIKIMFESSLLSYLNLKNDNHYQNNSVLVDSSNKKVNEKPNIIETDFNKNLYLELRKKIVNNTFCTAKKELLIKFKEKYSIINDYKFDNSYSRVVEFLLDTNVRAVGENELILSCPYESSIETGINLLEKLEKLLEKIYNKKYSVAIITDSEWETEKNKFISKKNNGEHYEYVSLNGNELEKKVTDNNDNSHMSSDNIVSEAIEIFGEDIVKVE